MRKTLLLILMSIIFALIINCNKEEEMMNNNNTSNNNNNNNNLPEGTTYIPPSSQRAGDAAAGYSYLVSGDYLSSGVPYNVFTRVPGMTDPSNKLGRTGDNAIIPHDFTAVNAPNGVRVVAPNCLQCHAGSINGNFIVGLGNAAADFTSDQSTLLTLASLLIIPGTPEHEAFEPFKKATAAVAPNIVAEVRGANVADKLGAILAAHRDKHTLVWNDVPSIPIPAEVVPTDVPPWWVLKKKNAMFYAGNGRGDFPRYLMASSLLTMKDSSKANEVNQRFPDVLAYIMSLEPPPYPGPIDTMLANEGKLIFNQTCSKCHGTYGDGGTYPNLLVSLETVGTDPLLSDAYQSSTYNPFKEWFNTGWFGKEPNKAQLVAEGGYIAQPLDGIWASAPYLHNGSVPTLEDLLNSSQRPVYWKRTFDDTDYDFVKVGWNYSRPASKTDKQTYDTTLPGYGNQGHLFGDPLTPEQRAAVIEYLKTL